jgi:hypothetical protein
MATFAQAPADLDALAAAINSRSIVTAADRMFGAQFIRSRILDRTAQGVDFEGSAFEGYSASYAKQKRKAGGRTDQVDLYGFLQHPHMLNAMLGRVTEPGFQVGFYNDEEADRARWNNEGMGRLPVRHFFDATEQDRTDVREAIGARITARLTSSTSLSNLASAVED